MLKVPTRDPCNGPRNDSVSLIWVLLLDYNASEPSEVAHLKLVPGPKSALVPRGCGNPSVTYSRLWRFVHEKSRVTPRPMSYLAHLQQKDTPGHFFSLVRARLRVGSTRRFPNVLARKGNGFAQTAAKDRVKSTFSARKTSSNLDLLQMTVVGDGDC